MSTQDARSSDREKEDDRDNHRDEDSHDLTDDTPIVVGGGGSTYVWILKTEVPPVAGMPPGTLLPFANPDPQYPIDAGSYYCYEIPRVDLGSYKTHDGQDEGNSHPVKNRR